MNWSIIMMEMVIFMVLFTAMVLIPAFKNPLPGIHNYPPEIQEEYETFASLQARLKNMYAQANVDAMEAMASFVCRKES